jgi:transposase
MGHPRSEHTILQENEALRKENAELREAYSQLSEEHAQLREEHAQLQAKQKNQAERIDELMRQVEELQRQMHGRKSEKGKVPPLSSELAGETNSQETGKKKPDRTKKANHPRQKMTPRNVVVTVADTIPLEERQCPHCHQLADKPMGSKENLVLEYLEAAFDLIRNVRETCVCPCGHHIVTAECPDKPFDKCQYGPGFISHLVVSKCLDSIPLNRLKSIWARQGVDISVNTMYDLFHRSSDLLKVLADRIGYLVSRSDLVQADETPITVAQHHGKPHRAYAWTFLNDQLAYFKFSPSRSGETPKTILGGTQGTLVVDGYSGYNPVTLPEGRVRSGCWAHVRRKFYHCLPSVGEPAEVAIRFIRELYRVEHDALKLGITKTEPHLAMRQERSAVILEAFKKWLDSQSEIPPKSALGEAISYALNHWESLCVFLTDARIPLDNNASERALRKVAMGRNNWLFVGNSDAGESYATLMTVVTSCIMNHVNPEEYIKDVLMRLTSHRNRNIDEMLPHQWKPPSHRHPEKAEKSV